MEHARDWLQRRADRAGVFSSALFCLWLSLCSLAVLLGSPAPGPSQAAPAQIAEGAPDHTPTASEAS